MSGTLVSPGVQITVVDDSFYVSGGQSTVPLIFIGTHEYKVQPNGTSVALGTLPENANTLYLITSQRELLQTFGNPVFYSQDGTPQNGYELNEYGLHAAYQYLGTSNTAYVIRAPIDYTQLRPTTVPPVGEPIGGTYWLNTSTSSWGVFMANGSTALGAAWNSMPVSPIVEFSNLEYDVISSAGFADTVTPVTFGGILTINGVGIAITSGVDSLASIAANITSAFDGVTAVAVVTAEARFISGIPASGTTASVPGQYYLVLRQSNTTTLLEVDPDSTTQSGLNFPMAASASVAAYLTPIRTFGATGSFAVITLENDNVIFQKLLNVPVGVSANTIQPMWFMVGSPAWSLAAGNNNQLFYAPHNQIPTATTVGNVWIKTTIYNAGVNLGISSYNASTGTWQPITAPYYASTVIADVAFGVNKVVGSTFILYNVDGTSAAPIASQTPYIWDGANWNPLQYNASAVSPVTVPESGTYWFMDGLQADIMINNGGEEWVGYRNYPGYSNTDPLGVIIAGSAPTLQTDNTPLVTGDLWINSSNMEDYPQIYRYNSAKKTWALIDNTDDTTPYGVIFQDARWSFDGTNASAQFNTTSFWSYLVNNNYVDPDAPDPRHYPDGMLLFNTRIASQTVKQWNPSYFLNGYNNEDYTTSAWTNGTEGVAASYGPLATADIGRWVTASGNNLDGSPKMGRKAQRAIIVQYLGEATNNLDLLSEAYYYNLIACPGYVELMTEMTTLNNNKASLAFIVGDTPVRLDPSGTSITNWANADAAVNSEAGLAGNNDDVYSGIYYPWGISTNVDGTTIVIPPSTTMLQVIAYSDSISYVWMPPAGYTRGLVTNASNVGYIDAVSGNFKTIQLNQGQRDVLYNNNINPIAYIPNRGLVVYGQKTRDANTTAMDRVNVSRLVNYLRYHFDIIAKPFLFELNTTNIRQQVTTVFNTFLTGVMSSSGVYDFIVVCDTTNNTPSTIDANELWIDIAIQPAKAIEFIYIPLRLVNTGTDMGSLYNGQTAAS
jgi:hypothetical protein